MNKEYILSIPQKEMLNTFTVSTKYPMKELQDAVWNINSKKLKIWLDLWEDSLDYEDCEFEVIPDNTNYKLIIYTNETDN